MDSLNVKYHKLKDICWMKGVLQPILFWSIVVLFASTSLSSCITNHCNESVYAPLNIRFQSEVDTAKSVQPIYFSFQGIGTDSIIYGMKKSNINVNLKTDSETTQYITMLVHQASETIILTADTALPFIQTRIFSDGENSMLVSIPSSYYSSDSTKKYQIENFNNHEIYFEGEMWIYRSSENERHIFSKPSCDTLTINHRNNLEFVSAECGIMNTHEIVEAYFSQNNIGSIIIENPLINDQSYERHIKLLLENYD